MKLIFNRPREEISHMPFPEELDNWLEEVSSAFPHLSKPQAQVLGLYSYGMALTKHCGQTIVCVFLGLLLKLNCQTLRQRLREFTYEAGGKRGKHRRQIVVEHQFEALSTWVVKQWAEKKQIVLAADVTYLKDRHTILTVSVLYGHTAIPVAWVVLPGNAKGEWHPLWLKLLASLVPALRCVKQVVVLFDRGLYSKRLFLAVRGYGWHPFMRIREQGSYRRANRKSWKALKQVAYRGMHPTAFPVHCFKGDPLAAYLWVQWDGSQAEACLLLSDLAPKQVKGNPYPLRMWIEASFKDWKRGGLHLEQCKTVDPLRLARLLLVLTLGLFYLIRLGNGLLHSLPSPTDLPSRLSLTTLGWLHLLVSTVHPTPLHQQAFHPCVLPPFSFPKNLPLKAPDPSPT
jgi:hypothetical protein